MKVTMLAKEYPPHVYGGAGVHLDFLTRELSKLVDVEVRTFGDQDLTQGHLRVQGYGPWEDLECTFNPKFNSLFDTLSTNLSMLSHRIDSDLVHTHTWYAHFAGYLAKLLYKAPLVATSHSLEPLRPWKRNQLDEAYDVSTWMEKVGLEGADRVIAVSRSTKEDILQHLDINPERVTIVPNGIDLEKWKPTPMDDSLKMRFGIEDDYVLFVGRPTPQKGMEHLVEASEAIDMQIVMAAVGADTKAYEDRMKELVKPKRNLVWINERLEPNAYVQLYSSARVFVCPSIYEPFGIINLEAMACETPVVASAVGGIVDVVTDKTGILVPPADPKHLSEAVNQLLKDEDRARQLGKNGKTRVETHFSWTAVAQKTKGIYETLL